MPVTCFEGEILINNNAYKDAIIIPNVQSCVAMVIFFETGQSVVAHINQFDAGQADGYFNVIKNLLELNKHDFSTATYHLIGTDKLKLSCSNIPFFHRIVSGFFSYHNNMYNFQNYLVDTLEVPLKKIKTKSYELTPSEYFAGPEHTTCITVHPELQSVTAQRTKTLEDVFAQNTEYLTLCRAPKNAVSKQILVNKLSASSIKESTIIDIFQLDNEGNKEIDKRCGSSFLPNRV